MEKIDIVYILGSGSRWNDNEIRFSLRSIEKYFLSAGRVFIIGECPEWAQNVVHIPAPDKSDNKLLNARQKYTIAATDQRIGKNFVLMNDDFFFLQPIDEILNYSRGTLKEMINSHPTKSGYYYRSLWDTRKRLNVMGIEEPIDFEVHAPMVFNKENLLMVMGMVGDGKAYSIRSCYGNLMGLEPAKVLDYKAANSTEFALQKMNTREFLSINDAVVADEYFRNWIRQRFSKQSNYEIHEGGLGVLPGRPIGSRRYHARKEFTYGGNFIHKGDLLPKNIINAIKNNPKMADVWEWK